MSAKLKFYAYNDSLGVDNYLFTFKANNKLGFFQKADTIKRINNKYKNVRAIFYVDTNGHSQKIWSSK